MEKKKIYIVYSFGGQWEDKWEHIECAFTAKEDAESYIREQEDSGTKISDELFEEIESYLAEKEWEMQCKYYDPNTAQLYEDANEEDYNANYDEFENLTKYELIKEKFGIEKDDYDKKERNRNCDFVGYSIHETELHYNTESNTAEQLTPCKPCMQGDRRYSDISEVEIDGEKWWHVNGYLENKPEDRKLKVGDAIVYRQNGCYKENSVMIIGSFDFLSDISARALIGESQFFSSDGTLKVTYYSLFAPSFSYYRMAKREEVEAFLEKYKQNNPKDYKYFFRKAEEYNNPIYQDLLRQ